jgi:hypothetical protein
MPLALLPLFLAACQGTSHPAPLPAPGSMPSRVDATSSGVDVRLAEDNTPVTGTLEASAEKAWPAVLQVVQEFGLPLNQVDHQRRILQVDRFRARREIRGVRMSQLFDCGFSMSGNYADLRQIHMTVQIGLAPQGTERSTLGTRITAAAHQVDGTSTEPVRCGTKGMLERMILESTRNVLKAR